MALGMPMHLGSAKVHPRSGLYPGPHSRWPLPVRETGAHDPIVQLVERRTLNPRVVGSRPTGITEVSNMTMTGFLNIFVPVLAALIVNTLLWRAIG